VARPRLSTIADSHRELRWPPAGGSIATTSCLENFEHHAHAIFLLPLDHAKVDEVWDYTRRTTQRKLTGSLALYG